ncbi:hypothetical protein [Streptomyces lydicamycinicus]|uniref:hypothetical protein n=1 Tax=Streptomyces lydicamycinicus TaxID=1546107 RepID=UPI003C2E08C0
MTHDEALEELSRLAHERAFGGYFGSDMLIQAGLDALLAGVESESLAMLAGLGRNEELEAPELFERVLYELGLEIEVPPNPRSAKWALASWLAGRMVDGSLDPAAGAFRIWRDVAWDLDYPDALQPLVVCAYNLDDWDDSWVYQWKSSRKKRSRQQHTSWPSNHRLSTTEPSSPVEVLEWSTRGCSCVFLIMGWPGQLAERDTDSHVPARGTTSGRRGLLGHAVRETTEPLI